MQQLRALVELSRLGTVSAAAESLGFSQSTVSHQLAALSRATGAVLLTRAGRGVRLTEEGRALAARGQEILDQACAKAKAAGLQYETGFEIADEPADGIIKIAHDKKADVIVVASHGRGGLSALLLGSATRRLISNAKIDLLVVRNPEEDAA